MANPMKRDRSLFETAKDSYDGMDWPWLLAALAILVGIFLK